MSQPVINFDFLTSPRILFGAGRLHDVGKIARDYGERVLVVCSSAERAVPLLSQLQNAGLVVEDYLVKGEPTIDHARVAAETAHRHGAELIIGFGGGSPLDLGKATAALATNPNDVLDYVETIGANKPLTAKPLPFIAIPTTAGTGSEVTKNAVLASNQHRVKVSLRADSMIAVAALVDPDLLKTATPEVIAYAGLDAITQVIEPFTTPAATPFTDALCRAALSTAHEALIALYKNREDARARNDMALVSLTGGMALANARLGAVHGFAGVIGGMTRHQHGAICARLLPFVTQANLANLDPDSDSYRRYIEIARLFTGKTDVDALVEALFRLTDQLHIPTLGAGGLTEAMIPEVAEKAAKANSMKGNPVLFSDDQLQEILRQSI